MTHHERPRRTATTVLCIRRYPACVCRIEQRTWCEECGSRQPLHHHHHSTRARRALLYISWKLHCAADSLIAEGGWGVTAFVRSQLRAVLFGAIFTLLISIFIGILEAIHG
jgi:hypothetical protein